MLPNARIFNCYLAFAAELGAIARCWKEKATVVEPTTEGLWGGSKPSNQSGDAGIRSVRGTDRGLSSCHADESGRLRQSDEVSL
jgi:hypothetical protein